MNFKEIYEKIKEGKKARRKGWENYIYYDKKMDRIYYKFIDGKCGDNTWDTVSLEDALADDWEVVEESKVWKPKKGEKYWYIYNASDIVDDTNDTSKTDEDRFSIGNCFKTEEEAQYMVEKLKVIKELKDFALENNEEEIDWNNPEQDKYTLILRDTDNYRRRLEFNARLFDQGSPFNICFTSEEICKQAAEKVGIERILKYYFNIKEEEII